MPFFAMQDRSLKFPEDMLAPSCPLVERRFKPRNEQAVKCPRCDSLNTKFCYYNNYSLSQPRHFCKNCKRYWTKGGALRNVPVGGVSRKNKRAKQGGSEPSGTSHQSELATAGNLPGHSSSCPPAEYLPLGPSSSVFYSLPNPGDPIDIASFACQQQVLRLADQPSLANCRSGNLGVAGSGQFSSFPPSPLASLSSHWSGLLHLRNGLVGLDFTGTVRPEEGNEGAGDQTTIFGTASQQLATVSTHPNQNSHTLSLALGTLKAMDSEVQWKMPQQKLVLHTEEAGNVLDGHLMPLEDHQQQSLESLRHSKLIPGLPNLSLQIEGPPMGDWQSGHHNFFEATTELNYWNNGAWSYLSSYGPSANTLL